MILYFIDDILILLTFYPTFSVGTPFPPPIQDRFRGRKSIRVTEKEPFDTLHESWLVSFLLICKTIRKRGSKFATSRFAFRMKHKEKRKDLDWSQ